MFNKRIQIQHLTASKKTEKPFTNYQVKVSEEINIRATFLMCLRAEGENRNRQKAEGRVGEGKLFAISKFLRAKHSSVQRLIAFLLEGVWKKSISRNSTHKK